MIKLGYQPGNSVIHRLYPLTKLAWLLSITSLAFFLSSGIRVVLLAAILFTLLMVLYAGVWRVRGFRFACITALMLFILYLLFDKSGPAVAGDPVHLFSITLGGLDSGLVFSGRFLAIIFVSYLFVLTTDPSSLAYALMKFGVPYRFGFMLVTALRLAPLLEEEGRTIYRAQLVRGVRYDKGGLRKMIILIRQFLTPLLITALSRADKLVISMEGRGFGKTKQRTFHRQTHPTGRDFIAIILLLLTIPLFLLGGRF